MLEQKKSKTVKRIEKICQDECVFLAIPHELSLSKWFDMGGEGNEELEYKNEKELFENFNDFIHQIDQNPSWDNQKDKVNFINHGLTRIENRLKELNLEIKQLHWVKINGVKYLDFSKNDIDTLVDIYGKDDCFYDDLLVEEDLLDMCIQINNDWLISETNIKHYFYYDEIVLESEKQETSQKSGQGGQ